jgi:hypothetical protein
LAANRAGAWRARTRAAALLVGACIMQNSEDKRGHHIAFPSFKSRVDCINALTKQ